MPVERIFQVKEVVRIVDKDELYAEIMEELIDATGRILEVTWDTSGRITYRIKFIHPRRAVYNYLARSLELEHNIDRITEGEEIHP